MILWSDAHLWDIVTFSFWPSAPSGRSHRHIHFSSLYFLYPVAQGCYLRCWESWNKFKNVISRREVSVEIEYEPDNKIEEFKVLFGSICRMLRHKTKQICSWNFTKLWQFQLFYMTKRIGPLKETGIRRRILINLLTLFFFL